MMNLYALVRTPDDGVHLYRLGEHEDTGAPAVCALLDGIRAAHGMPDGWVDLVDEVTGAPLWGLSLTEPLDPDVVRDLAPTLHDLTVEG